MSARRCFVCVCLAFVSLLGGSLFASEPTHAARDFERMQWIAINNGPNTIDIDGGDKNGLVFQAHRENYNAHSFEYATFYQRQDAGENPSINANHPVWSVIPFFAKDFTERDSLETVQGADCRLRDWIVLRKRGDKRAPLTVIVANRDFGDTYVDKRVVTFTVYQLQRNRDGVPGSPATYFSQVDQFQSKQTYCDADIAIRRELGVNLTLPDDSGAVDN